MRPHDAEALPHKPELGDAPPELLADVAPCWQAARREASTASRATSTEPMRLADAGAQAPCRADAGVQASPTGVDRRQQDQPQLAAFLARAAPAMLAALAANTAAAAAGGRRGGGGLRGGGADAATSEAEALATLTAFATQPGSGGSGGTQLGARPNPHRLELTGLSWSSTGGTLAAAFGRQVAAGCGHASSAAAPRAVLRFC